MCPKIHYLPASWGRGGTGPLCHSDRLATGYKDREKHRQRQRHRETERQRHRETERQRHRETERQRHKGDRETERE